MLSVFLIFAFLFQYSSQCIALGCLGFGGCGSSCLFGLCLQAPIIQPIGCPCGVGFMCMRGGCVARAAAGTKTFKDEPPRHSDSQLQTPDEHFATCCSLLEVPAACTGLCSYESYTSEEVSAVLMQQASCPMAYVPKIHFCAARGTNHTECCSRSLVPPQCHSFCDLSQDKHVDALSMAHLQCVHYFDDIKMCFVEHANSEYFVDSSQESSDDTRMGAAF